MKDPIHLCDVVLYDGKTKREYRLSGVVLVGNDKELIWQSDLLRRRILSNIFKTKSRIDRQQGNLNLSIKSIDYNIYLGDSFHNWGLSK
tara:strand:- start:9928 stop:10194 length:267 start_codon:yes stop_codon:yes gene_type:complete